MSPDRSPFGALPRGDLPIDDLRDDVVAAFARGPVVLSAPTGSGKSTQVPRWLGRVGPVVVVEPRRVAAQSLAARIAELEGVKLGAEVGFVVRDKAVISAQTQICFVTPGIALRWWADGRMDHVHALVLDEFHERGMDLDLLLALARASQQPRVLVMSATLAGDRIAEYVGGEHLQGLGRLHPVDIRYLPGGTVLPDGRGLEDRVLAAIQAGRDIPGDVLVFLPGKGEIRALEALLSGGPDEVLALHGGLSLDRQRAVFHPGARRRVVLATNVAETSLTIPRIGLVIDSGLVRRTRYRSGRGFLTLLPVAMDAADQRAGRAGRLGPGVAMRLWRADAPLDAATPPEVLREDLTPLILSAAACGSADLNVAFLDPPPAHAIDVARDNLSQLGALDDNGLTERGRRLFGLPLDAHLARLLVEGEARGTLDLVLPLCAGLSTSRPLWRFRPEDPAVDLGAVGCDAVAIIRAVRHGTVRDHGLDPKGLDEARSALSRFCRVLGLSRRDLDRSEKVDRRALADTVLAAWPRCAHIKRDRKRNVAWANGGTELSLGRGSVVDGDDHDCVLVLEDRAFTPKPRKDQICITAAMPVPLAWLVAADRGREVLQQTLLKKGQILGRIDRVYAGRVIASREEEPVGELARAAVARLVLDNRLFKGTAAKLRRRLERQDLHARLSGNTVEVVEPKAYLEERLATLGLETCDELSLLVGDDLLPDALPPWERDALDREFPASLDIGDARYRISYAPATSVATLHQVSGTRKLAPPVRLLPVLKGWRIDWEHKNRTQRLRH